MKTPLQALELSPAQVVMEIVETYSKLRSFTSQSPARKNDIPLNTPEYLKHQVDGFMSNIDVSSLFQNLHEQVQGSSNELKKAIDELSVKMTKLDVSLDTRMKNIST